jgi:hypothetical protein
MKNFVRIEEKERDSMRHLLNDKAHVFLPTVFKRIVVTASFQLGS